jgi:hypothetical protein
MASSRTFFSAAASAILVAALVGCAAGNNRPNVTLNAGCMGCTVTATAAPKPPVRPDDIIVAVPNDPQRSVTYTWHNRSYEGAEAFLQVVRAEVAASVEKVKPSGSPPYGSLKVAFPTRTPPALDSQQNAAGVAEAQSTWLRAWQEIDEGRLKALKRSQLFTSITSETANIGVLDAGAADFALWFDNGLWHVRYHKKSLVNIANAPDPFVWIGIVNTMAKAAKAIQQGTFTMNMPTGSGKIWFTLLGKDYFAVEPMIPVMKEEFLREARETPPLPDRLGGRAKIVLATFSGGPGVMRISFPDPENTRLAWQANQEYALAAARGRVEALRRSNIFDSITVETADVSDVSVAGYDYVLWQPATNPWTWRYRIAGIE